MPRYKINKGGGKKTVPLKSSEKEYQGKICCKICGKLRKHHKKEECVPKPTFPKLVRSISGEHMVPEKAKKSLLKELAQLTPRTVKERKKWMGKVYSKISGQSAKHGPASHRIDVYEAAVKAAKNAKSDEEFLQLFDKLYIKSPNKFNFSFAKGFLNKKPKKKRHRLRTAAELVSQLKLRTFLRSLRQHGRSGPITEADRKRMAHALGIIRRGGANFEEQMSLKFPHQCCPGATKFVTAHGRMIPQRIIGGMVVEGVFKIPQGVNIITLTTLSYSCPFLTRLHKKFQTFYEEGNTLFEKNDKSRRLTRIGKELEDKLNRELLPDYESDFGTIIRVLSSRTPRPGRPAMLPLSADVWLMTRQNIKREWHQEAAQAGVAPHGASWSRATGAALRLRARLLEGALTKYKQQMQKLYKELARRYPKDNITFPKNRFHIKNHLQGEPMNDQELQFYGEGCAPDRCSIDCFFGPHKKGSPTWRKKCPMKGYQKDIIGSEKMTLKKLVRKEGTGTYIMFSCRNIGKWTAKQVKLARDRSGRHPRKLPRDLDHFVRGAKIKFLPDHTEQPRWVRNRLRKK